MGSLRGSHALPSIETFGGKIVVLSNAKISNLRRVRVDISTGADSDAASEYQSGFITDLQDPS